MAYGVILGQTPQADIPVGGIILWSGSKSNIPTKWQLCDGTNGTPDLRGQFVIGAGGSYSVGNTGGEAEHTLTVNEMPSHKHSISLSGLTASSAGAHTHSLEIEEDRYHVVGGSSIAYDRGPEKGTSSTGSAGAHTHSITGSASIGNSGSSQPHNNLPPYYALCYIMKIA